MVQDHPNIVGVHGFFRNISGHTLWPNSAEYAIMMDFCKGDLWHLVNKVGLPEEQAAAEFLQGLLLALGHIHKRSMVHRDVKVENILLSPSGQAVLADFGFAALKTDYMEMKRRCGTPGYTAPEILMNLEYDEKVDIFAAGVSFYYMLCGRTPFDGPETFDRCMGCHDTLNIWLKTVKCPVKFSSSRKRQPWSLAGKSLTNWLLSKSPEDRPHAHDALATLEPIRCPHKPRRTELSDDRSTASTCDPADAIDVNNIFSASDDIALVRPSSPSTEKSSPTIKRFMRRSCHGPINTSEPLRERSRLTKQNKDSQSVSECFEFVQNLTTCCQHFSTNAPNLAKCCRSMLATADFCLSLANVVQVYWLAKSALAKAI